MGVVAHREAEVAEGFARFIGARLGHRVFARPQQFHDREREVGVVLRVGGATLLEQGLERDRIRRVGQALLHRCGQGDDATPALGRMQHAADGRIACRFEKIRDHAVGRDHQVFDQLLRSVLRIGPQVGQRAVHEHRPRLDRLQAERAALYALFLQGLRDFVLQPQLRFETLDGRELRGRRRFAFEPRGSAVVGELGSIENAGAIDRRGSHFTVTGDREFDHDRKPLFGFDQRCEIGREAFGQHRENPCGGIDRRGVGLRVRVDRRVLRDHGIDVGNRDQHFACAIGKPLAHRELVEVARVVVVDRAPQQVAQIAYGGTRIVRRLHGRRLVERCLREVGEQPAVLHRVACDVLEVFGFHEGYRSRQ